MKINDIKRFENINDIDLPKDDMSEKGVIGTILNHPEFILKSDYIKPSFFYKKELACIYHIVSELYKIGVIEIDAFMISTEIEKNKGFKGIYEKSEEVKTIDDYINELKTYSRGTVEEYEILCRNVITSAFKRESYIKLEEMQKDILTTTNDVNSLNYELQQSISNFSKIYICNDEIKMLGEQADKIWEGIVGKRNNGFFGFPSKFSELNNYASYEKTELCTVASPGKTGKSQFLANEAWHKAISGVPSLYIDRELSTENHMIRMLSHLTGIGSRRIKTGNTSIEEEKLIKEKLNYIKKLPYIHIYKPVTNMDEMYLAIKSLQLKHDVEFLVYDYIKANDGSDSDKEYQKLGKLCDWLKNDIAGNLNLSCLTACQMDDKGTKIADSQKILRNSSTILYLLRKSMEEVAKDGRDSGNMKLICHANRNGQIMQEGEYINLVLNGDIATLTQAKNGFTEAEMPY
jgi:replicative DNA helicase